MVKLHVKGEGDHILPDVPALRKISDMSASANLEDELDAIVESLQEMIRAGETPDVLMNACMAMQARCTEIYLQLVRIEGKVRKARLFRTAQLQKVMDLLEFTFKGASRLIEMRRQDIELSR
jgi:hypothetical protein